MINAANGQVNSKGIAIRVMYLNKYYPIIESIAK